MVINWLLTVFPREMKQAFRLVRPDLVLWISLSALMSLASATANLGAESGNLAVLVTVPVAVLMMFLPVVLFDAAHRGVQLSWSGVFEVFVRKAGPLVLYGLAAGGLCAGAATLAIAGVAILARGNENLPGLATLVSALAYIAVVIRFCFVPFVVVLGDRQTLLERLHPATSWGTGLATWLWPLFVSNRLGENLRWRIVPYVLLTHLGPLTVRAVPPEFHVPFLVAWHIVMLTAQAVFFDYFLRAMNALGIAGPTTPTDRPSAEGV
ncbi:MAG: hypothetical protein ACE5D3_06270 [Candidatus Binatia bacterium]